MKQCTKCKEYKPATQFGNKSWLNKDGSKTFSKKSHCRNCVNKDNLNRYYTKFETKKSHAKASYKHRIKSYGLTVEQYISMLEKQDNRCAICNILPDRILCIDHDHSTGKVRGLLCQSCNIALGNVKDDKEILLRMIKYLDDNIYL